MKVAAYQAPLLPSGSLAALDLIRARVVWCEANGVSILCCPETILGGLADDAATPGELGIRSGALATMLAPLASDTVTTIVGFSETTSDGHLFNSAVVWHQGSALGIYRKRHPAIRRSVYHAGNTSPVFEVGGLVFGILICNDSNFPQLARAMAAQGATALFIPTSNGLLPAKGYPDLAADTRKTDIATAIANRCWVIRADVAGDNGQLQCEGSSGIVDPDGTVVQSAAPGAEDLLVADLRGRERAQV
jgi:predicted amidohydrolase